MISLTQGSPTHIREQGLPLKNSEANAFFGHWSLQAVDNGTNISLT